MTVITGKSSARRVVVRTIETSSGDEQEIFFAETERAPGLWHRDADWRPKTQEQAQAWCDSFDTGAKTP
ncbi:MAG: hypothetical protein JWR10_2442 [Rubritepida sp.]|nr:hypothetical protein [Rubritepida sp.]